MKTPELRVADGGVERPGTERCVLCVDDDLQFLKSLEFFLPEQINRNCAAGHTYRFIFLSEPLEALDVIQQLVAEGETVAMLITDQQMPNMKGTEFLTRARELVPTSVRVLLTGHSGIDAAIVAINERLLDKYLTKPIESEHDFMLSVKHLLDRFELERRLEQQNALILSLYEFANRLNAATDTQSTLRIAAEFTKSALGCEEAQVILEAETEPDAGESRRIALVPHERDEASSDDGSLLEAGIAPTAADCPWYDLMAAHADGPWPSGAMAYATLTSGSSVLGLILAWEPPGGPAFTEESLRALSYIATSASIALQNRLSHARLEEIARTRARHLEEARGRLQILDRLKSDFLSFVSHELRTPLNHMSAVGMLEDDMDQKDRMQMVAVVRTGYDRLERFIMNSLEYFEWFSARPDPCDEPTDLAELIRGVVARRNGAGQDVEWELQVPEGACHALFPPACAEKLLDVLVDNAIKFSIGRPHIRLALGAANGRVTLSVSDRGHGFPPEWAGEIFRPFTIADPLHHREGTALNLAKAAAMLEAYGGRIRATSAGLNQGATFTAELPAREEGRARVVEVGTWPGGRAAGPDLDDEQSKAA